MQAQQQLRYLSCTETQQRQRHLILWERLSLTARILLETNKPTLYFTGLFLAQPLVLNRANFTLRLQLAVH